MRITCLGTAACVPEVGNDSSCYLLEDRLLLDTGWNAADGLRRFGGENARTLLLTHTHHDHLLGLPGFLFDVLNRDDTLSRIKIYGPEETDKAVSRALEYLQVERFYPGCGVPEVHLLHGDETLEIEGFTVETHAAHHPVPALCLKIGDGKHTVGFTGDTSFDPALADFFSGADLLFSECSFGLLGPEPDKLRLGHLDLPDARRMGAKAKQLVLVHLRADLRDALPKDLCTPGRGEVFNL